MELPTLSRVSVGCSAKKAAPAGIGRGKIGRAGSRGASFPGKTNGSVTSSHRASKAVAVASGDVDTQNGQQDGKAVRRTHPIGWKHPERNEPVQI